MTLQVALFGSSLFGERVLRAIHHAGHDVNLVVSPATWGDGDHYDLLRQEAHSDCIPWIADTEWHSDLMPQVDVLVAAHYTRLIGRSTLAQVSDAIGLHPSLLPRHRGRDAIRWTIHMRDFITGFTAYQLTGQVDAGPIAAQDWIWVCPTWTAKDLWRALQPVGERVLCQALTDIDKGSICYRPQPEWAASWEPSWERPPLA